MKAAPIRSRTPPIALCGTNRASMSCGSAPATRSICEPTSPQSSSRPCPRPTGGSSRRFSAISLGWGWTRPISPDGILRSETRASHELSADESGLPLFAERRHTFCVVPGHMQLRLHHALDFEIVFETGTDSGVKELLCQSEGESRSLGELRREFLGLAHQLVILDDVIDEAERQGLVRLDKTRREDQLLRLQHADPAGQEPDRAAVGRQTDAAKNLREARRLRRHHEIACECDAPTDADGRSAYRGDDRFFDRMDGADEGMAAAL